METTHQIAEDLIGLATPVADLKPLPGNPRRGDVEAVARSYKTFGQRKPVVALLDGTVIAGNHQLAAAKKLGWSHLAVVRVDDDETTAKAFAIADNRTADLGTYDDEDLLAMLKEVCEIDPDLLAATGYTERDLADMYQNSLPEDEPDTDEQDIESQFAVVIYCEDEAEQTALLDEFISQGRKVKGIFG